MKKNPYTDRIKYIRSQIILHDNLCGIVIGISILLVTIII